jgi:hypothetical protein
MKHYAVAMFPGVKIRAHDVSVDKETFDSRCNQVRGFCSERQHLQGQLDAN